MNVIKNLSSGCMPNTDFTYEDLESLLASYYLTYRHLEKSDEGNEINGFKILTEILEAFSSKYNLQTPQETLQNVRTTADWFKPRKMSYSVARDSFRSFYSDFGIADEAKELIKKLYGIVTSPGLVF